MIFDAIIQLVIGIFTGILGLLPGYEVPDFGDFGSMVGSGLGVAGVFFPVPVLGWCLVTILGFRVFMVAWSVVVWIYDKLPFKFS